MGLTGELCTIIHATRYESLGAACVARVKQAIQDGIAFAAYSCEYIANILEMRARETPEPGALHLTRRQDLLDIEIAAPDLSLYEGHGNDD